MKDIELNKLLLLPLLLLLPVQVQVQVQVVQAHLHPLFPMLYQEDIPIPMMIL